MSITYLFKQNLRYNESMVLYSTTESYSSMRNELPAKHLRGKLSK